LQLRPYRFNTLFNHYFQCIGVAKTLLAGFAKPVLLTAKPTIATYKKLFLDFCKDDLFLSTFMRELLG